MNDCTTLAAYLVFADTHWFLAWCALWLGWIPLIALFHLLALVRYVIRMVVIAGRGWPPGSLDGNVAHAKEAA